MTAQDRSARISQLQEEVDDYCRKVAKGKITTLKGRPLTALQRLFMENAANGHIAKKKGGITLATLLMVFPAESWLEFAEDDDLLGVGADYAAAYEAVLLRAKHDVLSGHLVVRNVLTLFKVNEADEVRAWAADPKAAVLSELTIRLVIADDDVKDWLKGHDIPVPDWLFLTPKKPCPDKNGEFSSEMRLLIGLAVVHYKFEPTACRNEVTGRICEHIRHLFDIDRKTLLARLRDAAAGCHKLRADSREKVLMMILGMSCSLNSASSVDPGNADSLAIEVCKKLQGTDYQVDHREVQNLLAEAAQLPRKPKSK